VDSIGPFTGNECQTDLSKGGLSQGHTWDVRLKLIALAIFVFGVIALQSIYSLLLALALVFSTAVIINMRMSFLFNRLKGAAPFLVFIYAGLLLGRGGEHFYDSLQLGGVVSLKALTSIMATLLLLGTQSVEQILKGLSDLRLPPVLITVLFLSYRYLFMFRDIIEDTQRAVASRGFHNVFSMRTLKVYGEICGALFVKALDRSEIVLQSMEARGFEGTKRLRATSESEIKGKDFLNAAAVLMMVILLLWLDRSVFI